MNTSSAIFHVYAGFHPEHAPEDQGPSSRSGILRVAVCKQCLPELFPAATTSVLAHMREERRPHLRRGESAGCCLGFVYPACFRRVGYVASRVKVPPNSHPCSAHRSTMRKCTERYRVSKHVGSND